MTPTLTPLEERLLACQGMPAAAAACAAGVSSERVLEVWRDLKDRGVMPRPPSRRTGFKQGSCTEQLSFDQIEQQTRGRRAPHEPADPELGWTTDTEGNW